MIWKNLTDKIVSTLVLIIFIGLGSAGHVFAQDDSFAELKQKFEQGAIFSADFQHQSIDSYTQDTVASDGRIWVGEQHYKVESQSQTVVVDGQVSRVYDDDRNRLIISKYEPEEDDFAPSRILNGVDSTFTVKTQEERDGQTYILLESDDDFAIYKKVEIYLDADLVPQKIEAVDPSDNIITTTFEAGTFVNRDDSMFDLDYPQSAEVVDMRN